MGTDEVWRLEKRLQILEDRFDRLIWTIAISGIGSTATLVMFIFALLSHKGGF